MKRTRYRAAGTGSKQRLFWILALFFIALSLPVYVLLNRVYVQLDKEMFFNARQQAERLIDRIDQTLQAGLQKEQARPMAEYSFFNVLENPLLNASGLKFSPLSELSPKTDVAGLVGYFQIDADSSFHIPALPEIEQGEMSGLSARELAKRLALKDRLKGLLAVDTNRKDIAQAAASPGRKDENRQSSKEIRQHYVVEKMPEAAVNEDDRTSSRSGGLTGNQLRDLNIDTGKWERELKKNDYPEKKKSAKAEYITRKEIVKLPDQSLSGALFNRPQQKAAAAPDEQAEIRSDADFKSKDQTAESRLDANVVDSSGETKPSPEGDGWVRGNQHRIKASKSPHPNLLPEGKGVHVPLTLGAAETERPVVLSFESEVGPLQLIKLASGHLCFYRQVWHNRSRFIQGFVVDGKVYWQAAVQPLFSDAAFSSLLVAYQGQVLQQFGKSGEQPETLLYRSALLPPFQSVELIVNTVGFDEIPGKPVVDILAMSLSLILLGGIVFFYRLGSKQIDLSRQQQNFISSVSHELKTPLTSIRMYGEMLRSGWVTEETRKKAYYDYIFFESERLSRLIANVLQLAKLENRQMKPELTGVSPEILLQKIKEKIIAQIEATAFVLTALPYESLIEGQLVKVDEDAFYQIVINLVDNALKFAADAERKEIIIGIKAGEQRKELAFFVRDFGPGIRKDQIKKIFKLFYRAGDEMTRTRPGTGIGLALAQQLAETMAANITVENRQPGAEFQVILKLV